MLVLEASLLLTVGCTAVGVMASWWFTRRHYTRRVPRKLTPEDVEIAKARHATITAFLGDYGALMVLIVVGGVVGVVTIVAVLLYNLFAPGASATS